jgi:hypothetical protein
MAGLISVDFCPATSLVTATEREHLRLQRVGGTPPYHSTSPRTGVAAVPEYPELTMAVVAMDGYALSRVDEALKGGLRPSEDTRMRFLTDLSRVLGEASCRHRSGVLFFAKEHTLGEMEPNVAAASTGQLLMSVGLLVCTQVESLCYLCKDSGIRFEVKAAFERVGDLFASTVEAAACRYDLDSPNRMYEHAAFYRPTIGVNVVTNYGERVDIFSIELDKLIAGDPTRNQRLVRSLGELSGYLGAFCEFVLAGSPFARRIQSAGRSATEWSDSPTPSLMAWETCAFDLLTVASDEPEVSKSADMCESYRRLVGECAIRSACERAWHDLGQTM